MRAELRRPSAKPFRRCGGYGRRRSAALFRQRAHRAQRPGFELFSQTVVIIIVEFAHLPVEFEFAQTLHGQTLLMLELLELTIDAEPGTSKKTVGQRSGDKQRHR